jgi:hypothetical protein
VELVRRGSWASTRYGAVHRSVCVRALRARTFLSARRYFAITESSTLDPGDIWSRFRRELEGTRSNPLRNPLNHEGSQCVCVRCVLADGDNQLTDIVEVTRSDLTEGHVRQAFDRVNRVRGIGPTIGSFFLRDLAVWFMLRVPRDRELLQPIDVWVRRYVGLKTGHNAPTDRESARWLCSTSAEPESANQGLWYFSAITAASEVRLRRALADGDYAARLVEEYVENLRRTAIAWEHDEMRGATDRRDPPRAQCRRAGVRSTSSLHPGRTLQRGHFEVSGSNNLSRSRQNIEYRFESGTVALYHAHKDQRTVVD